jgi:hypothetical protein
MGPEAGGHAGVPGPTRQQMEEFECTIVALSKGNEAHTEATRESSARHRTAPEDEAEGPCGPGIERFRTCEEGSTKPQLHRPEGGGAEGIQQALGVSAWRDRHSAEEDGADPCTTPTVGIKLYAALVHHRGGDRMKFIFTLSTRLTHFAACLHEGMFCGTRNEIGRW